MEGKHKNYARAVRKQKQLNKLGQGGAESGGICGPVPRPQLTLERIYLLKYEIYIPLNKLFSRTATAWAVWE